MAEIAPEDVVARLNALGFECRKVWMGYEVVVDGETEFLGNGGDMACFLLGVTAGLQRSTERFAEKLGIDMETLGNE